MTHERTDLLAGTRGSLHVVTSATGKRQVRGNLTHPEHEAARAAIDSELEALRRAGFAFDSESDVQRPFDLLAIIQTADGAGIVVDPLGLLAQLRPG